MLRLNPMEIVQDTPGVVLVLEGRDPTLPTGFGGVVGGVFAAAGREETLWRPFRLAADRGVESLRLDEVNVATGEERHETIALPQVTAIQVRRLHRWAPAYEELSAEESGPRFVEVSIRITDSPSPRERRTSFRVEGIDTLAEMADFAFRLGSAAGMSRQRVIQSDPRRIAIEMTRDGATARPMPAVAPADYATGVVSPEAVAAVREEIVPPFEPAAFPSDHRVTLWSPGDEVRFDKPLEGHAVGCLPLLLAGLALGPAVDAFTQNPGATRIWTAIGVVVSAACVLGIASGLPHRVKLQWSSRTLTIGGWLRRRVVGFDHLAGLELQCIRTAYHGRRGQPPEYRCEVLAHLGDAPAWPLRLLATTRFPKEPETPYDRTLPLVTELARALGVDRTVTDYR